MTDPQPSTCRAHTNIHETLQFKKPLSWGKTGANTQPQIAPTAEPMLTRTMISPEFFLARSITRSI
ncbi:hypothetical protein P167DRAFT_540141 [Morchella conica CCBAS932]|uniref:Uncharacterized protein n=1 Tax=Morchella conica CCBAS932 TaxID=1392247 RepID=A0A3N4KDG9_9PEZI|nr:hypothetical protein P167DRAFT_540141 [Morchella conica CCBAS932]